MHDLQAYIKPAQTPRFWARRPSTSRLRPGQRGRFYEYSLSPCPWPASASREVLRCRRNGRGRSSSLEQHQGARPGWWGREVTRHLVAIDIVESENSGKRQTRASEEGRLSHIPIQGRIWESRDERLGWVEQRRGEAEDV